MVILALHFELIMYIIIPISSTRILLSFTVLKENGTSVFFCVYLLVCFAYSAPNIMRLTDFVVQHI
jgi:hypothetical protein